jgi:prolyl-tRNA editing enzyme YbaK/EbsC (Cys-tRNA(Pro) deacylase)
VNEAQVAALVGEPLDRADADFVRAETGFAIGGVAPIGHVKPVVTLIDEHLLAFEEIWAAAGHPNTVFRLRPADLVTMTGGRVATVS